MTHIAADRPYVPSDSSDNDTLTTEIESHKIEKVPLGKRMVAITNILLLMEKHGTTNKQLTDWCECAQSTMTRLLSRTQYCDYVVEKIAEYYHVTVHELGSTFFKTGAFLRSFPKGDQEISEKRAQLKCIGQNIDLLCKQKRITNQQLADTCDCKEATIRQIKKGLIDKPDIVDDIAKFFQLTTSDLCTTLPLPSKASTLQNVASNITFLMQHHGIAAKPLAQSCKCSDVAIDKIKNGRRYFPNVASKIAEFFHVTVSELSSSNFKTTAFLKSFPTQKNSSDLSTLKWSCFAENLHTLRKKLGIQQQELANHLRVSYQIIDSLEAGNLHDEELAERVVKPFKLGYFNFFSMHFTRSLDESILNSVRQLLNKNSDFPAIVS